MQVSSLPIFNYFSSIIGIRRSETTFLAIGRRWTDNLDYLVRFFRVKPDLFELTLNHLEKCQKLTHKHLQEIVEVIGDAQDSEICIVYQLGYTLLEIIESKKFVSNSEITALLSHLQAGLSFQKSRLGTENNFFDEWNVFQSKDKFTIGASLPIHHSQLILPLSKNFQHLDCEFRPSPAFLPPEMLSEMSIDCETTDMYSLGVIALIAMGGKEPLQLKLGSADKKMLKKEEYEVIIDEIIKNVKDNYNAKLITAVQKLMADHQRPCIEETISDGADKHRVMSPVALSTFHTFVNGKILEPGPNSSGHHGE